MAPIWGKLQAGVRALTTAVFRAEAQVKRLAAERIALRGRRTT
jgi:hypothetical protein